LDTAAQADDVLGGRMQILVCGASGLIGPVVVRRLLEDGHSVTALDVSLNPGKLPPPGDRLTLRRGDVGELGDVLAAARETGAQRIINLAFVLPPESESNPCLALRVNVLGMSNVFEAARLLGLERVIYASSVAAHGGQEHFGERGVNEDDDCFPINLYGASKYFDDIVARRYIELYGTQLVGVRIATVFGYGRETGNTAWIGKLASLPALGQPAHCPLPSAQQSAMIYVDDVAEILVRLCLASKLNHRLYHSGGDTCSLSALAEIVRGIVPQAEISLDDSAPDFPHVYIADDTRLREDIGYRRPPLRQRVLDHMNVARAAVGQPPIEVAVPAT
jgi:nucleoside-diphosphate-sugar epimerase